MRFAVALLALLAACDRTQSGTSARGSPDAAAPATDGRTAAAAAADDVGAAASADVRAPSAGNPLPSLSASIMELPSSLIATKPFGLAVRLENRGDMPVTLEPLGRVKNTPVPWATLELSRNGRPLSDAKLARDERPDGTAAATIALPPLGRADLRLPEMRAPTAAGRLEMKAVLRFAFGGDRDVTVETPTVAVEITWSGLTVLHIGDSLVSGGLIQRLEELVRGAGGRYVADGWVSSNAPKWLGSDRLLADMQAEQPEIVFVTLGTNEYDVPDPVAYASWYSRLATQVGRRPCFWIGPPALDGVDALVDAMSTRVGPCVFFDSRSGPRPDTGRDRDHYTHEQAARWADAIWAWIGRQWIP